MFEQKSYGNYVDLKKNIENLKINLQNAIDAVNSNNGNQANRIMDRINDRLEAMSYQSYQISSSWVSKNPQFKEIKADMREIGVLFSTLVSNTFVKVNENLKSSKKFPVPTSRPKALKDNWKKLAEDIKKKISDGDKKADKRDRVKKFFSRLKQGWVPGDFDGKENKIVNDGAGEPQGPSFE